MANLPEDFLTKVKLALERQVEQMSVPEETDDKAENEATAIAQDNYEELQRRKAETAGIVERNRDRRINRKLRTAYAKSVFCYLVWYSLFVAVLLLLSGFEVCGFSLPESVLSFLVGSTAAAAIGLVYSVTNGLFSGVGKDG